MVSRAMKESSSCPWWWGGLPSLQLLVARASMHIISWWDRAGETGKLDICLLSPGLIFPAPGAEYFRLKYSQLGRRCMQ